MSKTQSEYLNDIIYLLDSAVECNNERNYGDEDNWKFRLYEIYREYKDAGYDLSKIVLNDKE